MLGGVRLEHSRGPISHSDGDALYHAVTDALLGVRDADGYFWYIGRDDDVFKSSDYRISPFELESALIEHDAVAEAAVVGVPSTQWGETPVAFVVRRAGHLTPEQAMQIASQLEQICPLNDEASEILNRSRRQYAVFSVRNGVEPLNIVEPDTLVRVSSLMKSGHPTPSAISYVRSIIVASRGETPQVLSLARIAWERSSAAKQEAKAAIVDLLASCCR